MSRTGYPWSRWSSSPSTSSASSVSRSRAWSGSRSDVAYDSRSCSECTRTRASADAPARSSRSRTGTPRHVREALHPSTHAIGSVAVCWGSARQLVERELDPVGARRPRPRAGRPGSCAESTTPAATAERFTGKPCGPVSGRRGASSASLRKGHTVWPTVTRVSSPAAPATSARNVAGPVRCDVDVSRSSWLAASTGCGRARERAAG